MVNNVEFKLQKISVQFLCLLGPIIAQKVEFTKHVQEVNPESFVEYGVYYNVEPVLHALRTEMNVNDPSIRHLLNTYDKECQPNEEVKPLGEKRFPFIVIEGNRRKTSHFVAAMLSNGINSKLYAALPSALYRLRHAFNGDPKLKKLYFALSFYINSCRVRRVLNESSVVLDGYWTNQAAFFIAKQFVSLPAEDHVMYQFPDDLLKPDYIIFVNGNLLEKTTEFVDFTNHLADVYRRMRGVNMYELKKHVVTANHVAEFVNTALQPMFPHIELLKTAFADIYINRS